MGYRGILIRVSTIGYGRGPDFEVEPQGAPSKEVRLAWAMLSRPAFKKACEKEGLRVDWEALARIVGGGARKSDAKDGPKRGIWSVGAWSKL